MIYILTIDSDIDRILSRVPTLLLTKNNIFSARCMSVNLNHI